MSAHGGAGAADPLRRYLREIAALPLLTREQEVALARRAEEGERRMASAIAATAAGVTELLELGARLRRGELAARQVTRDGDDDEQRTRDLLLARFDAVADAARVRAVDGGAPALLAAVGALRLTSAALRAVGDRAERRKLEASADVPGARASVRHGERIAEDARAELVRANLRLVAVIAHQYAHRGLPLADLIQEGNLGLIRGIEKFDYRRGFKVSTYVVWWIRQSMARAVLEKARTIRVPAQINRKLAELARVGRLLAHTLGREPTSDELAQSLVRPVAEVRELARLAREPVSLDAPAGVEGEATVADFVRDESASTALDATIADATAEKMRQALSTLTAREEQILRLRFGVGHDDAHTLEQIGRMVGLTRERIRQIEQQALGKLRRPGTRRQLGLASDE